MAMVWRGAAGMVGSGREEVWVVVRMGRLERELVMYWWGCAA